MYDLYLSLDLSLQVYNLINELIFISEWILIHELFILYIINYIL